MAAVCQPPAVRWVAGVDGRRGGWAVALVGLGRGSGPSRPVALHWHTVAGQDRDGFVQVLALARAAGAEAVGADVPIGLPADDWRSCDLSAKRRLGRASARVFLAPPREVLAAPDYGTARAVARVMLGGRGVSAQTYGLRAVVLAVDDALVGDAWARAQVVEVHPELSFMALAGRGPGEPLESKRTPPGRAVRAALLGGWLGSGVRLEAPDGDDHLDALAAAWSADRWARGEAEILGGDLDSAGLPMRIVI
jgi:predicted RNase H-like nuclease